MRFKRPQVRYADTPQPATPYQSAAQVWDERIGLPRVQAKNWRLMAFGCLVLALLMAGGLVLATLLAAGIALFAPQARPLLAPLLALWLVAPGLAWRSSRRPSAHRTRRGGDS